MVERGAGGRNFRRNLVLYDGKKVDVLVFKFHYIWTLGAYLVKLFPREYFRLASKIPCLVKYSPHTNLQQKCWVVGMCWNAATLIGRVISGKCNAVT